MHTRPSSSIVLLSLLAACEGTTEPAALAAPADQSLSASAAGVIRDHFRTEIELTFDCTAAGGEIIDVSGSLVQTLTVVLKDEFIHFTFANAGQGLTGVGRVSGDTYRVTGMGMNSFTEQVRPSGGTFVSTFQDLTHPVAGDGTLWGVKFTESHHEHFERPSGRNCGRRRGMRPTLRSESYTHAELTAEKWGAANRLPRLNSYRLSSLRSYPAPAKMPSS
jgi:hypothetical protein